MPTPKPAPLVNAPESTDIGSDLLKLIGCPDLASRRFAALRALFLKCKGRPAAREVAIAKIAAGETYTSATIVAHQLWGAMGYARESGLYLWSERAKVTDARFGTAARHLRDLQMLMGI